MKPAILRYFQIVIAGFIVAIKPQEILSTKCIRCSFFFDVPNYTGFGTYWWLWPCSTYWRGYSILHGLSLLILQVFWTNYQQDQKRLRIFRHLVNISKPLFYLIEKGFRLLTISSIYAVSLIASIPISHVQKAFRYFQAYLWKEHPVKITTEEKSTGQSILFTLLCTKETWIA